MLDPRWNQIDFNKTYVISGKRLKDLLRRSTDVHGTENQINVVEDAEGGVSIEFASTRFCWIIANGTLVPAMIPIFITVDPNA